MKQPLLIEIGVEELPAIPFLKEYPKIKEKWHKVLKENNLSCDFDFYYTPRRLVLLHKEFPLRQDDSFEEFFGAPKELSTLFTSLIAIDNASAKAFAATPTPSENPSIAL